MGSEMCIRDRPCAPRSCDGSRPRWLHHLKCLTRIYGASVWALSFLDPFAGRAAIDHREQGCAAPEAAERCAGPRAGERRAARDHRDQRHRDPEVAERRARARAHEWRHSARQRPRPTQADQHAAARAGAHLRQEVTHVRRRREKGTTWVELPTCELPSEQTRPRNPGPANVVCVCVCVSRA